MRQDGVGHVADNTDGWTALPRCNRGGGVAEGSGVSSLIGLFHQRDSLNEAQGGEENSSITGLVPYNSLVVVRRSF